MKSIYGEDNRMDLCNLSVTDPDQRQILKIADSVVALVEASAILDNNDRSDPADPNTGTSSLAFQTYKARFGLCDGERFSQQPSVAYCSGALISHDLILTAGHCIGNDAFHASSARFVFGYRMRDQTNAVLRIPNRDIYSVKEIIGRAETSTTDWAVVRLARPVIDHQPLPVARFDSGATNSLTGRVQDNTSVFAVGYPCGLPAKYCPSAKVRDNSASAYFIADLDTYGGNSGSPVFANINGHYEIVGVLVRGLTDFDFAPGRACRISLRYREDQAGEACTRTTEFAKVIPE
jgi:V8-like Glu-specific endopeptidase